MNFQTINSFRRNINNDTITLKEADKDQRILLLEIMNLKCKIKAQKPKKKQKKVFLKLYMQFLMVEKEFLRHLKAEYFL